jgi:hypothetical protein
MCDRDLASLDGLDPYLKKRFVWTALSRCSGHLFLDFSVRVRAQVTPSFDSVLGNVALAAPSPLLPVPAQPPLIQATSYYCPNISCSLHRRRKPAGVCRCGRRRVSAYLFFFFHLFWFLFLIIIINK